MRMLGRWCCGLGCSRGRLTSAKASFRWEIPACGDRLSGACLARTVTSRPTMLDVSRCRVVGHEKDNDYIYSSMKKAFQLNSLSQHILSDCRLTSRLHSLSVAFQHTSLQQLCGQHQIYIVKALSITKHTTCPPTRNVLVHDMCPP